jgi:hypothetical protein
MFQHVLLGRYIDYLLSYFGLSASRSIGMQEDKNTYRAEKSSCATNTKLRQNHGLRKTIRLRTHPDGCSSQIIISL